MANSKQKAQYAPPSSQVDLEERLENGNASGAVLSTADSYQPPKDDEGGRDYRVEGNEIGQYVGTSPEYATYANETEQPLRAEDSVENEVFEKFAEGQNPQVPEGWEPGEAEAEVTVIPANSANLETPDGAPVPQSATTASTDKAASSES